MKSREFYFLLLIEAANAFNNIVTLRKENEVCCITQDVTLATFISPPFTENSTKSLSLLIGEDWSCDNWILTDGSKSLSGSVTDKRWENLDVIKTNYKTFTSVQSVSFSLYSPGEVHLFANDDQDFDYNDLKEFKNGWNHISIFLRNNNVFYLLNNKVIKSVDAFNPHNITIITNNDTLWKIHDYQFIMSEKVTDGKHITLTLPHTENDCFLLYVSLCEKCVLTIPELNRIYNSTNDQSVLNSWQVYQLEIETGLEHLRFYKTTTDNSTLGYWGIDLHECPTNDIVSHKVNAAEIEENNYLCYVLNQEYKMERQMEEDSKSVNVESCEEDLRCKCIWGYTDSYDDINTLTQTDCKEACNLCNKIANKDRTEDLMTTATMITLILSGILGILLILNGPHIYSLYKVQKI